VRIFWLPFNDPWSDVRSIVEHIRDLDRRCGRGGRPARRRPTPCIETMFRLIRAREAMTAGGATR
jgi:hypothetical protein